MTAADREIIRNHGAFIWSVADLSRGDYRRSEYGRVILPLVVLRRLDCVLDRSKGKVLRVAERYGAAQTAWTLCCVAPRASSSATSRR